MSKRTPGRTLGSERVVAARLKLERERRGWTYDALARRMEAEGVPIQISALHKIEKADPPRRVTLDEAIALANVFKIELKELVEPIAFTEQRWAEEVARDFIAATSGLDDAHAELVRAAVRLAEITRHSPDLAEFVAHQWKAASPARQWFAEFVGKVDDEQLHSLTLLGNEFWEQVLAIVDDAATRNA